MQTPPGAVNTERLLHDFPFTGLLRPDITMALKLYHLRGVLARDVIFIEIFHIMFLQGVDIMYAIYLRKSRADQEAETRGEGETLARHEQELTKLSIKMKLPIGAVYKEIVSGETISARPWMQQLLL